MKTDAERMALIRQRTTQLQRQARARQMLLIDAGCMAACLVLVVCLGLAMPGWAGTSVALHVSPTGTAGMLSERGADGYILVGVLSFLLGSCVATAIEIAPVCEEILKLLPLLLYFLIFEPDSHKLTPAAIGIAVGFATFENVCYLTENGAGSFVFLLIRGMSAGALHLVCGILTGLALAYVFRRPWLTCTGTVGILGVCMVLHGIYNLLITADGFWQMVGYFFPSAIIVTLFAARLLHRGRHTVFR